MAKNISLLGANYPNVPAVQLPQTGGGTATFYDLEFKEFKDNNSKTTYSITLPDMAGNTYKGGYLCTVDPWNPAMWLITCSGGATPSTVTATTIFSKASSVSIASVSITNGVLNITFNGTVYGGIRFIWLG